MENNFLERLESSNQKAIDNYKKTEKQYLEKIKNNIKYATYIENIVLAFIETYDYDKEEFDYDNINPEFKKTYLANPVSIKALIYTEQLNWQGEIDISYRLNYNEDTALYNYIGLPSYMEESEFDLNIINDIFYKLHNGISINKQEFSSFNKVYFSIKFPGTILVETRKKLLKETEREKEKVLSQIKK